MGEIKDLIIKEYEKFLEEKELQKNQESIDLFSSFMFYEIQDNLDYLCEIYGVPSELEGCQTQEYIEGKNEKILKKYIERKKKKIESIKIIDDFGRIALSPDLRKKCKIKEGDSLEIYINKDNTIILKKHNDK